MMIALEKVHLLRHLLFLSLTLSLMIFFTSSSSTSEDALGTRVSFDIPDHVPNICNECDQNPSGNCGVALKCICHPKECKDRVISNSRASEAVGSVLISLGSALLVVIINIV